MRWTWLLSSVAVMALGLLVAPLGAEPKSTIDEHSLERRVAELERQERELERSLSQDEQELRVLEPRVVARGRAYYRLSRGGPATRDWFEHAIRVERLRRGLLVDMKRLEELKGRRREQREQLVLVRERLAPLAAERSNFEQLRAALQSQREREEAFQRAFSETRAAPHMAIYGAGLGAGVNEDVGFVQMRGRLPFPLPGRAEVEQVRRPWADGAGLAMRAPPGTSVRTVFGGRVAFADEYGDYGKTVIMDHGHGYYTVSAGLGSIEVRVGDDLAAGSRLGVVKTSTTGRGELYFEVRRGNDTLAPSEWFGI